MGGVALEIRSVNFFPSAKDEHRNFGYSDAPKLSRMEHSLMAKLYPMKMWIREALVHHRSRVQILTFPNDTRMK